MQMALSATSPFGIGDVRGTVVTDCPISPGHAVTYKRTFDEERGSVIHNLIYGCIQGAGDLAAWGQSELLA